MVLSGVFLVLSGIILIKYFCKMVLCVSKMAECFYKLVLSGSVLILSGRNLTECFCKMVLSGSYFSLVGNYINNIYIHTDNKKSFYTMCRSFNHFSFIVFLFFVPFLNVIIYFHLVAENFGKSFYIVSTPGAIYFAVFTKIGFH